MRFDIITIFPKIFDSYLQESLIKRAQKNKIMEVAIHNLRDWSDDKHLKVDDRPFGGGPGMVLKIEPIYKAVQFLKSKIPASPAGGEGPQVPKQVSVRGKQKSKVRIILFSARGKKLDAKAAKRLAKYDRLILICGRYEGVDERVAEYVANEEISIGDYVLSGGELPALVLIEAVSRFLPGFLGKEKSLEEINGSFPTYTRPEVFKIGGEKLSAPAVLVSGNHEKIKEWREKHSAA